MKALITGIGGFVGPYLLKELKENGYEVSGTYIGDKPKLDASLYEADLLDSEALKKALSGRPDVVFHLAAVSDVGASFDKPELCMKVNAGGTRNLLRAIKEVGFEPTVLIVGSAHEYGIPESLPITEDHPLKPNNPYAESKVEAERIAREEYPDVILTRSFNHAGPDQTDRFVLSAFASQIASIENGSTPVIKVGNLDASRDFLDVRDVVRAYRLLVEKGTKGQAYNVCSGKGIPVRQLLDMMLSMSTKTITKENDPKRMRPSDIPELYGSNQKLVSDTGWKQEIDTREMLKDILEHWRQIQ